MSIYGETRNQRNQTTFTSVEGSIRSTGNSCLCVWVCYNTTVHQVSSPKLPFWSNWISVGTTTSVQSSFSSSLVEPPLVVPGNLV